MDRTQNMKGLVQPEQEAGHEGDARKLDNHGTDSELSLL